LKKEKKEKGKGNLNVALANDPQMPDHVDSCRSQAVVIAI